MDDGEVMALEHVSKPIFGVQYHPESVCAGAPGKQIVRNMLSMCFRNSPLPRAVAAPMRAKRDNTSIELHVVRIADPVLTCEQIFRTLFQHSDSKAWLDSAMEHPTRGRTSLLTSDGGVFGNRVEFFVPNKRMGIDDDHDTLRNPGDCVLKAYSKQGGEWKLTELRKGEGCEPFSFMSEYLEQYKPGCVVFRDSHRETAVHGGFELLPFDFACGYVGTMGYGLRKLCGVKCNSSSFEKLQHASEVDTSGLMPDLCFFFADRAVIVDHSTCSAYVLALVSPQVKNEQLQWIHQAVHTCVHSNPEADVGDNHQYRLNLSCDVKGEDYISCVNKCLDKIRQGETYEVCLTTQFRANAPDKGDPFSLYTSLRLQNPAPFCAYLDFMGSVSICSSSPERFVRVDRNHMIESRPIKGTRQRNMDDPVKDAALKAELQSSKKDRSENLLIVDLVRNDLGKVCETGSVQVPDLMVVESFATVHQLVSTVQGKLKPGVNAVTATRACFPPGSMTGAPKLKTMQVIDDIEVSERGFYSGCLGFFSVCGAADLNVLIRTLVWSGSTVSVGAGGAVVILSEPSEEQKEMILKVQALGTMVDLSTYVKS